MLGPLLFDNRGAIVKKIVLQKKTFNSKKKIKIEGVAFILKKYLKSHFRDPKKRTIECKMCARTYALLGNYVQFNGLAIIHIFG